MHTTKRMTAVAMTAAALIAATGAGPAAAEDFEAPIVWPSVPATGSTPRSITVRWGYDHVVQGINHFSVVRESPSRAWPVVGAGPFGADQWHVLDSELEPDTKYRYKVCAHFITEEDEEPACSDDWVSGETSPPQPPTQSQRPPTPRIVEHHAGETWIGIKWDAGYDYDSYFVNITGPFGTDKGPRELRTIHHDDDGTWGYQRVDGLLPSRTYTFGVQGCTETIFGIGSDNCWDWSAGYDAGTLAYPQHSGADTCAPPFVWRGGLPGATTCAWRCSGALRSPPTMPRLRRDGRISALRPTVSSLHRTTAKSRMSGEKHAPKTTSASRRRSVRESQRRTPRPKIV